MEAEIRWCLMVDGKLTIYQPPTATDALEYAESLLEDDGGSRTLCNG